MKDILSSRGISFHNKWKVGTKSRVDVDGNKHKHHQRHLGNKTKSQNPSACRTGQIPPSQLTDEAGGPVSGIKGTKETLERLKGREQGFPASRAASFKQAQQPFDSAAQRPSGAGIANVCLLLTSPSAPATNRALLPRSCMRAHGEKKPPRKLSTSTFQFRGRKKGSWVFDEAEA